MVRSGPVKRRMIEGDCLYDSVSLARFINAVMKCGGKSIARKIVYEALNESVSRMQSNTNFSEMCQIELFNLAISNAKPDIEVRSKRIGGANYQIPVEVRDVRANSLAMRWIVGAAQNNRKNSGSSMIMGLASEFCDACNGIGGAVRKRDEQKKAAQANRAFAHFRW